MEKNYHKNIREAFITFLNHSTMKYFEFPFAHVDYKMILEDLLILSSANHVALNIYDGEKHALVTEEISSDEGQLKTLMEILGHPVKGKCWKLNEGDIIALKSKKLEKFPGLYELSDGEIPKTIASIIKAYFKIGDIYSIGLCHNDKLLGNILFFMGESNTLVDHEIIELFVHQLGIILLRKKAEEDLREKEIELNSVNEEMLSMNEELESSLHQLVAAEEELRDNYHQLKLKEEELKESEERWKFAIEGSGVGVWDWNLQTMEIHYSNKALEMFGYDEFEAIRIEETRDRVHPDDTKQVKKALAAHLEGETPIYETIYRVKCHNKEYKWILDKGKIVSYTEDGKPLRMVGTYIDFSERKQFEDEITKQKQIMESLFEYAPDAIARLDIQLQVIDINRKFTEIFGYNREECIGKHIDALIVYEEVKVEAEEINDKATQSMVVMAETYRKNKDGHLVPTIIRGGPTIVNGEIIGYHASYTDITERRKAEDRIKYLSYHDKLTGLYNRAYFEEQLEALDSYRYMPISIIIGDVNGLKLTNDVFGHLEGDNLLINVAEILIKGCRHTDIISRWGGDEFAIILPNTNEKEVIGICNRIKLECVQAKTEAIQISIALGYATKTSHTQKIREIIKEAEEKMYRHKLLENRSTRSQIINSLQTSLFEKSHETKEHAERMNNLGIKLGKRLGLNDNELDELSLLTLLHDIGKIAIPDSILTKPGSLTDEEWEIMKKHPEIGYRIAESSQELFHIADYILNHHERWDGNGYPQGLMGEEIPKLARILTIIDAYDVMTNSRTYKDPITHQEAINEMEKCSGKQFDPQITSVFIELLNEE
ncbi:HD domain-containing phosphohydrolase [Alkaliphilus peptidifermentans]|uniref:PAS domain S-box-containing protein/diguanylate cyclase (GGDEF) domain-containing protein n=1 Tax=Alkaliphilus peptidifermentans DSM 18978 TaxID=1120976 RepID=A0A1G5JM12_9FIRM|nr:HD domain-containing phosphohydrolase [Alkaliphilus peptidifermentans]SCY89204.1 PAS domain S-box-containing protein/diguanylate cyclase (GGDEF) domain-containing protein [Alkaliphilus peptidifermentans DSM 18978]